MCFVLDKGYCNMQMRQSICQLMQAVTDVQLLCTELPTSMYFQ